MENSFQTGFKVIFSLTSIVHIFLIDKSKDNMNSNEAFSNLFFFV